MVKDALREEKKMEKSPLFGKKIVLNGDSICAARGGYGRIIAERCGMEYQNVAVSGGTVAAEQYEGERPRHCISRTVCLMDEDADYAIVEGGVNDAAFLGEVGAPLLGRMSDGYDAELDDTTFYGAFESMLKELLIRFPGKKVGYIAVHKMTERFSSDYEGEDNFYLAARACCEKWGVPFLDLNTRVPAFGFFAPDGDPELYALRERYTNHADGWHPNDEGYLRYYCDKIEAWLRTL